MGRKALGLTRIQVALHPPVLKALRSLAKLRGCTTSELVREACRQYVLNQIEEIKNAQKLAETSDSPVATAIDAALSDHSRDGDSNNG